MTIYEVDFAAIDAMIDEEPWGVSVEAELDPTDLTWSGRRPSYEFIHTEQDLERRVAFVDWEKEHQAELAELEPWELSWIPPLSAVPGEPVPFR